MPSTSSRLALAFVLVLFVSCAAGPTPSSVILARPVAPLLDTPVLFQRMMPADVANSGGSLQQRAMPRRLIVTPQELTMPGGNGNALTPWEFTLSFATVETVEVRTLAYDPLGFMGRTTNVDGAVIVTDQRGACKVACVFMFADKAGAPDLETANRFAAIIQAGRDSVDAFGRNDGPRPVAAAFGLRAPRPVWRTDFRAFDPDLQSLAETVSRSTLRYAETMLRTDFRTALSTALHAGDSYGRATAWSFEPVTDLEVNRRTELNVSKVRKSEQLQRLQANSLLVSDVYGLGFTYVPPVDGEPAQVETVLRAYVDFFDLEPLKDGRYFWFDFSNRRNVSELVSDPAAAVRQDIERMCNALASRIRKEISNGEDVPP